jgi:rsbT co-antagonist protein RsbR
MEVDRYGNPSHHDESTAEELLKLYRITIDDLDRLREFKDLVSPKMGALVEEWYDWLQSRPDFEEFFSEPETLERVQKLQDAYWNEFLSANVDDTYVSRRRAVGEAHASIGLPLNTYFAGMNLFCELFASIIRDGDLPADKQLAIEEAVIKLIHFDTAIVVDTYNYLVEEALTAQSKSLMEMSTPVTQIWSGILLLPIVGLIDSKRARDIMNATLDKIGETQARIFILDISGVGVVDTAVANHLIKITRATRLMGCECTISGVSPSIAQTIVDLGIDVGKVKTTATMKDALSIAFHRVGMEITQVS